MSFEARVDPQLQAALQVLKQLPALSLPALPQLRAQRAAATKAQLQRLPENLLVSQRDTLAPGPAGAPAVPLRVFTPTTPHTGPRAAVYWIHGGGMVMGSVDQDSPACVDLAQRLDCVVVSVEYRLAPEHPYPAPVEDCYAGLLWTANHADTLGVDRRRIALVGPSAGGGLAACTTLLARDRGGPAVAMQCLVSPMLDNLNATPSSQEFSGIPGWSRESNALGWRALLGEAAHLPSASPYASAARATDLTRLPPAVIQAGELEVFRDETIQYATRLMQAGIPTFLHVYPGVFHGWHAFAPNAAVSQLALQDRLFALKRALAG